MKNKIFIAISFLAIAILALASQALAVDWSQYESGRDNIRLDGYQTQPGYIAFTNGDGTVLGYLFASTQVSDGSYHLYWVSSGAIDLKTQKMGSSLTDSTELYDLLD